MPNIHLIQANAGKLPLADESIHCVVTSPPYYALRRYNAPDVDYGDWSGQLGLEPTPELFIEHMVDVFREVKRVLRGDGVCWVNMGDSYANDAKWGGASGGKNYTSAAGNYQGQRMKRNTGLKPKDLMLIPQRLALALQADGWWVRSFFPWLKCLSGGTRVYAKTQKGEMPMTIKDMVRLDPSTVKLWTGKKWTQVLGWQETPRGENNIEIHLRSGERIGSTPMHRWPTQRGLVEAKDLMPGDVVDFVQLPEPEDVLSPPCIPDNFGWVLGLYLAEGNKYKDSISLACNIEKVDFFEKLSSFARCYGATCTSHQTSEGGVVYRIYSKIVRSFVDTYISGQVAKDKHLSVRCWGRSNCFLQNLLMGYLEGDGHYDEKNNRWRLCFTKNDNLAADLRTLCARLGISLRLRRGTVPYNGERVEVWRGQIRLDTPLENSRRKPDTEIVKIETSRARKFWDIAVEDEPHLFALASGVLTHNSNAMPESTKDRPSTAHEYIIMLTKSVRYFYDADAVRVAHKEPWRSTGVSDRSIVGSGDSLTSSAGTKKGGLGDYIRQNGVNYNPAGRNRRTTDAWRETLDFAIYQRKYEIAQLEALRDSDLPLDSNDLPPALQVNPRGYPGAHYATFPPALVEPFIKAATSERGVCSVCGAQWERVVEVSRINYKSYNQVTRTGGAISGGVGKNFPETNRQFAGFRPTCPHTDAPAVPATVLDPFGGTGVTALTANALGRRGVATEISGEYIDLAKARTGLEAWQAWREGKEVGDSEWEGTLFEGVS